MKMLGLTFVRAIGVARPVVNGRRSISSRFKYATLAILVQSALTYDAGSLSPTVCHCVFRFWPLVCVDAVDKLCSQAGERLCNNSILLR